MSEIEKMYENAGIDYEERYNNCTLNKEGECKLKCSCDICKYSEEKYIYPTFIAEKQIELIKWLAKKCLLQINYSSHQCYQFNSFRVGGDYKSNINEALASHCNNLMQDLTEEERKQIKEILE